MQLTTDGNTLTRRSESIINQYFIKKYFHYGIQTTKDLRFDFNNIDSYKLVEKHLEKTNFLEWAFLRHSIPPNLRNPNLDYVYPFQFQNPSFNLVNDLFDVTKKKSKDYYSLLVLKKARLPNPKPKLIRRNIEKCFFTPPFCHF